MGRALRLSNAVAMGRQRTAVEWRREVEGWRASGASAMVYARSRGYSASSLMRWAQCTPSSGFARLEVVPTAEAREVHLAVEVGGATIRVERGFDAELLRSVVDALASRSPK